VLALLELVANALATFLMGAVPERQPWRAIVTSLYLIGAACGVALILWLIVSAF
jgi:hypothetical protein